MALAAGILSLNVTAASADPTPSPTPSTSIDTFRAAQEQFRKDRDIYMAAMRERENKMREINATFKSAVDKATSDAKTAMTSATTPDQKNSINSILPAGVSTGAGLSSL